MKLIISITLSFAFSLHALASDEHLRALDISNSVLESRDGAISLEKVKELAAGENVDARIAYERLYQAQQKISQARSQYFPYGVGEVLVLQATDFWNPLILAELVTSIPSKWFNVKRTHHLKNAQSHTLAALKENVKNEVANLYYETLKEEAIIALASYELVMLEKLMQAMRVQVQAGVATQQQLDELEYQSLKKREAYLKLESYLEESKASLKMLLGMDYHEKALSFQPVKKFLSVDEFKVNPEELALTALNRSHEMKASQQMIYAAYNAKRSAKWSILSFAGLGFDYLQRVHLAGSKVNQAIHAKKALEVNIQNDVYSKEAKLMNSVEVLAREINIMENSKRFMLAQLELFKAQRISIDKLIEANLYYIKDFAQTVVFHYEALQKLDDLERIALGNVKNSDLSSMDIEFETSERGGAATLSTVLPAELVQKVSYVTYSFESNGISDIKSFIQHDNFQVTLNVPSDRPLRGAALIFFQNGEVLKRNIELRI